MPVEKNDRPKVRIDVLPDAIRITWGPERGPWGIFREGSAPVEVKVKQWSVLVDRVQGGDKHEKAIFSEDFGGDKNEVLIPLHEFHGHKTVIAEVIGYFDSQKIDGTPFVEGIYSDPVQKELK